MEKITYILNQNKFSSLEELKNINPELEINFKYNEKIIKKFNKMKNNSSYFYLIKNKEVLLIKSENQLKVVF